MNESFDDSAAAVGLSELEATVRFPEPSSAAERSDLIDRAYEEYCERLDAGDAVDPDEFCARFPAFETSLRRLLQAHNNLENDPELLRELSVRWPEAGETFLGYRLLSELGRGAFRAFISLKNSPSADGSSPPSSRCTTIVKPIPSGGFIIPTSFQSCRPKPTREPDSPSSACRS